MFLIPLIRQVILGAATVFSIIVLALAADLISQTQQYFGATATFTALGVAVAAISLVTLPVMLFVDVVRRGAFTSMIIVELVWLSILWILWVAAAGETAYQLGLVAPNGCDFVDIIYAGVFNAMCQKSQAVEAFSFLNFIILLVYSCFLLVMAVIAASRGQSIWVSSVKESFGSSSGPVEHPMTQYNAPAPPQLHAQYTGSTQAVTPGSAAVAV